MSTYTDASLIVTPNAAKAGKLYSIKPTNGAGDLDVVRATSATRVNSAGLIETVGNNIARLDYSNGSCPSILVEPQRTNLVFPSNTATTQTRTVTAVAHTLSFYGTGSVTLSGVATGTLNGTGANNKVTLTFTPTAGSLVLTVMGSVTNWQLEAGSNATSYIPTTTSTVTRNADVISKSGISSLIGQTEGTIYVDFFLKTNNEGLITAIDVGNINNFLTVYIKSNRVVRLEVRSNSGSPQILISTPILQLGNNKIVILYKSGNYKMFLNGTNIGNSNNSIFPSGTLSRMSLSESNLGYFNNLYKTVAYWKTQITDAQAIQLTTL